jgi:hypothetical protein
MKLKTLTQTFNDGVLKIYKVGNIAEDGNMLKEGLTLKVGPLNYEERIVGMGRFWDAKQSKVEISRLLRVPRIDSVSTQDVVIPIDGEQYKVLQVQHVKEVEPPSMDLSLERISTDYDIEGQEVDDDA